MPSALISDSHVGGSVPRPKHNDKLSVGQWQTRRTGAPSLHVGHLKLDGSDFTGNG